MHGWKRSTVALLCWPTKGRTGLTGYSPKISISGWLSVSLGLLRWRLIGSKLAWAGVLEFIWSDGAASELCCV